MRCNICDNQTRQQFTHRILGKYSAMYLFCDTCGFLQVEKPHWLDEAYQNPINISDTGYVSRNIYFARKVLFLFPLLFGTNRAFLDYAGGYGMFTRLMRDYGLDFYWSDLHTQNLFAQGFEYRNQPIPAVTCFECFEHFVSPLNEIEKILALSKNVFFSTKVLPHPTPKPEYWDYYGFEHGQHISFYSTRTLQFIADKYGLCYYTDGKNLHLFLEKKMPAILLKVMFALSRLPIEPILKRLFGSLTTKDHQHIVGSRHDS